MQGIHTPESCDHLTCCEPTPVGTVACRCVIIISRLCAPLYSRKKYISNHIQIGPYLSGVASQSQLVRVSGTGALAFPTKIFPLVLLAVVTSAMYIYRKLFACPLSTKWLGTDSWQAGVAEVYVRQPVCCSACYCLRHVHTTQLQYLGALKVVKREGMILSYLRQK